MPITLGELSARSPSLHNPSARSHALRAQLTRPHFAYISLLAAIWLPSAPSSAQECVDDRVAIEWTQPPLVAIEDDSSLRWPVEGSIKVAYTGSWCPSDEQVSFTDVDGAEVPALLVINSSTQLVENGPLGVNLLLVKPLMSLAERADYTLKLTPPNPRLRAFEEVELSFKTHNRPLFDVEGFAGLRSVKLEAPCGEGYTDVNAENLDCVVPSHFNLTLTFKALPNPEVTYAIYRVSATAIDSEGQAIDSETDHEERLISFLPGATEEASARSINFMVSTLYAPLPREECYRVDVWDEWGRQRGETEAKCVTITQPVACPIGCDPEAGDCTFIFPSPEPISANEPLEGERCDRQGLYGADPETPIPELSNEPEPEPEVGGAEPAASGGEDTGCQAQGAAQTQLLLLALLTLCLWVTRRRQLNI